MHATRFVSVCLAVAFAACSDEAREDTLTSSGLPILPLTVPADVTLDADGGATLEVVAALGDLAGPDGGPSGGALAIDVIGLPDGLQAETELLAVDRARLVLSTTGPVTRGTYPAQVLVRLTDPASGAVLARGGAAVAVRVETPALVAVSGRVVDGLGLPVRGARVAFLAATGPSRPAEVVETDPTGAFDAAQALKPPYDIAVREPSGAFHVFRGVRRSRPVLHLSSLLQPTALESATLRVTVEGARATRQACGVTGPSVWGGGLGDTMTAYWPVGTAPVATAWALAWDADPGGEPKIWRGFGREDVTGLAAGRDVEVAVTLGSVETGWIAGAFELPEGHVVASRGLWLQLGDRTAVPLANTATTDAHFTWAVPKVSYPLGIEVRAVAGERSITHYLPGLSSGAYQQVALPEAPALVSPAAGATLSRGGSLRVSGEAGALRAVAVAAGGVRVALYGMSDEVPLPDVPELGLSLPSGPVSWLASTVGPSVESIDAFLDEDGGLPLVGLGREVTLGLSGFGTFTLAP